jgi:class 3 adenylate cyclase
MAELSERQRKQLPDSAIAHIDARGRRRLPIHDESHVRNALARFNQVVFEDEGARDRARTRLLKAAKKHGIVPIGFVTGQIRSARTADVRRLPTGFVTFLLADIEDSTGLLRQLGDRYADLLSDVRTVQRATIAANAGLEVDARADELFAVFRQPAAALHAAIAMQRAFVARAWPDALEVRLRIGLHSGRPTRTDTGYVGLAVHTGARVCFAAHGGQIVLSRAAQESIALVLPDGITLRELGSHQLAGLPEPELLFQVVAADLRADFPPPRTARALGTNPAAEAAALSPPIIE